MAPRSKSPSGKAMAVLASFVMLFVILSPMKSALDGISSMTEGIKNIFQSESEDISAVLPSYGADELCQRIVIRISDKFDIPKNSITPRVTFDMADSLSPRIVSTEVEIASQTKAVDEREIAEYVVKLTNAPCVVRYVE